MRSIGTLKIPHEDTKEFLDALNGYGFEKSAIFLRRCAKALMKHYKAGDVLEQPLAFKVVPKEKHGREPEPDIIHLSGKRIRKTIKSTNH